MRIERNGSRHPCRRCGTQNAVYRARCGKCGAALGR